MSKADVVQSLLKYHFNMNGTKHIHKIHSFLPLGFHNPHNLLIVIIGLGNH